jgi:hypothetical protein
MLAPAGAGVWVTPTIDVRRRALYVATGNAFSGTPSTSNAVMAFNMDTGKLLWTMQALALDVWHNGCIQNAPDNPPRPWVMPHLVKAVHSPKLLVLLYEVNAMYRQVFVDGQPSLVAPNPSWNGYSTGKWEGDTLVVQTNGFRDDLWIDMAGSPMSEAAVMTERIRRPNYGTLELEITINDPKNYTRPWAVKMTQKIELDTELIDEICLENEKSYQRLQAVRPKN